MYKRMRMGVGVLLCMGLLGCATLSEKECRTADWRSIGYEDGTLGRAPHYFGKHREACAKHGITAVHDVYRSGYDDGIRHYCRPPHGFELGRRGERYDGVCPPALEGAFLREHRRGFDIYELEQKVSDIEREIQHEETALRKDKTRITEIENLLVKAAGNDDERKRLLAEMRALEQGLVDHDRLIHQLLGRVADLRDELAQAQR